MAKISFDEASGSGKSPAPTMDQLKRKLVWHMSAYRFPEALGVVAKMLEIEPGHEMALKYVPVLKEKIALDREWQEKRDEREANGESSSESESDEDGSSSSDDEEEGEEGDDESGEAGADDPLAAADGDGAQGGGQGEGAFGSAPRALMSSSKRQELKAQLAQQVALLRVELEEYERQQALEGGAASSGSQPPRA